MVSKSEQACCEKKKLLLCGEELEWGRSGHAGTRGKEIYQPPSEAKTSKDAPARPRVWLW